MYGLLGYSTDIELCTQLASHLEGEGVRCLQRPVWLSTLNESVPRPSVLIVVRDGDNEPDEVRGDRRFARAHGIKVVSTSRENAKSWSTFEGFIRGESGRILSVLKSATKSRRNGDPPRLAPVHRGHGQSTVPARILRLIRNGEAMSVLDVLGALGWNFGSGQHHLMHILEGLKETGLIEWDKTGDQLMLTDQFSSIQNLLGLSLSELIDRPEQISVKPIFGIPGPDLNNYSDIFVLMPFEEHLKPLYEDHIRRVASRLDVSVKRADDFFAVNAVTKDIWEAIWSASVIVADCSGRNANVFYEIGIAHTLGRPVVLLTQDAGDVPFDLNHIRYVEYSFTPRGMRELEQHLESLLSTLMKIPFCEYCQRPHRV